MMVGGKIAEFDYPIEEAWTRIVDLFAAKNIECEFLFGPQNEKLEGSPPRIQFERTESSVLFAGIRGGTREFARLTQACVARVWGFQTDEDFEKHQCIAALGLTVELVGAIYSVCPRFQDGLNGLGIVVTPVTPIDRYGIQFEVNWQFAAPIRLVTQEQNLYINGVTANLTRS